MALYYKHFVVCIVIPVCCKHLILLGKVGKVVLRMIVVLG